MYTALAPINSLKNHNRSCAYDSRSGSLRDAASINAILGVPRCSACACSIARACARSLWCSNTTRTGNSTENASRTRDTHCVASNECPPSAKKSSSRPTRSTCSSALHTPASNSSVIPSGAAYTGPSPLGDPSALRSTFPLGSRGKDSSCSIWVGIRCSTGCSRMYRRSALSSAEPESAFLGTTYAVTFPASHTTAASRIPSCASNTSSRAPNALLRARSSRAAALRSRSCCSSSSLNSS